MGDLRVDHALLSGSTYGVVLDGAPIPAGTLGPGDIECDIAFVSLDGGVGLELPEPPEEAIPTLLLREP